MIPFLLYDTYIISQIEPFVKWYYFNNVNDDISSNNTSSVAFPHVLFNRFVCIAASYDTISF